MKTHDMKTLRTILSAAAITIASATALPASAQDEEIFNISEDRNNLRIEAAGFGITLGEKKVTYKDNSRKVLGCCCMDYGFSMLAGIDYSGNWEEYGDFLELKQWKSARFAIEPISFRIALDRRKRFWFRTALKCTFDNFRFQQPVTLTHSGNILMPVPVNQDIKKTKFSTKYFGIPVSLAVRFGEAMISANASAEILGKSWAKYKKPKVKTELPGFEKYRFTAGLSITYNGFGIYCDYSITPLFRQGVGPDCHVVSFGLRMLM